MGIRRSLRRWLPVLLTTLLVTLPTAAAAAEPAPDVIVGGSFGLTAGETLVGDVATVGAAVDIEAGATLDGNLITIGGQTLVNGAVTGDVRAFGGTLTLGESALVRGDLSVYFATYEPAAGSVVQGNVERDTGAPVRFSLPGGLRAPTVTAARIAYPRQPLAFVMRSLALGLLGMLAMAALPIRLGRVRDAMVGAPVRAGLDGLLTGLIATLALALVAVTIIGLPVALLGGLAVYAAVLFGWLAFGEAAGTYLAKAFEQTWSAPLRAGIGAFAVSLVVAVLAYAPVIGGLVAFILSVVALGAVRRTRLGSRPHRTAPPPASTEMLPET